MTLFWLCLCICGTIFQLKQTPKTIKRLKNYQQHHVLTNIFNTKNDTQIPLLYTKRHIKQKKHVCTVFIFKNLPKTYNSPTQNAINKYSLFRSFIFLMGPFLGHMWDYFVFSIGKWPQQMPYLEDQQEIGRDFSWVPNFLGALRAQKKKSVKSNKNCPNCYFSIQNGPTMALKRHPKREKQSLKCTPDLQSPILLQLVGVSTLNVAVRFPRFHYWIAV